MSAESFFLSAPIACMIFLIGLSWNLHIFKKYSIDVIRVTGFTETEWPSGAEVLKFVGVLWAIFIHLYVIYKIEYISWIAGHPERVTLLFCFSSVALLLSPFDIMKKKSRMALVRTIAQCVWPYNGFRLQLPASETPFVQVLVADGLTSISKPIQDVVIALVLTYSFFLGTFEADKSRFRKFALPYLAASLPYLIRVQQCFISYKRTSQVNDKFLHVLNAIKYSSSLLVIGIGAFPQLQLTESFDSDGTLFMLCAAFNSIYSFFWDVVMDFGLVQPDVPPEKRYLRHELLYKNPLTYYMAIVMDLALRILWVSKWSEYWHGFGADFKFVAEICEVLRRIGWNCIRIEWQCIKSQIGTTEEK